MTTMDPERQTQRPIAGARDLKSDVELRKWCIERAVHNASGRGVASTEIVEAAARFERYVRDGQEKPGGLREALDAAVDAGLRRGAQGAP